MPNIVDPQIPNYPPQGIQAQLDLLYLYNPDVLSEILKQVEAAIEGKQDKLTAGEGIKIEDNTISTNNIVFRTWTEE